MPEANPDTEAEWYDDDEPAIDPATWAANLTTRLPQGAYSTGASREAYRKALEGIFPLIREAATASQRVRLDASWFQRTFRKKQLARQAVLAYQRHMSTAHDRFKAL